MSSRNFHCNGPFDGQLLELPNHYAVFESEGLMVLKYIVGMQSYRTRLTHHLLTLAHSVLTQY